MAKLDLLTTFYDFHSQNTVLPILVTTVLKQKMTGKHGFVTHGTDSGLNNVLQYMRFVSSSVIIAYTEAGDLIGLISFFARSAGNKHAHEHNGAKKQGKGFFHNTHSLSFKYGRASREECLSVNHHGMSHLHKFSIAIHSGCAIEFVYSGFKKRYF